MAVVEARDLHRVYKTHTGTIRRRVKEIEAVRGVSFQIERGELFGLLGPNGAGKTTTIKMLITLLIPTSGEARVLGHDVVKDAREVRKQIGYVFGGEKGLYERLSALDNLRYFAELYAGPPRDLKAIVAERTIVEIEAFGVTDAAIERVRTAPGVTSVSVEERDQAQVLLVQSAKGLELTQQLLGYLDGATIGRVAAREPT